MSFVLADVPLIEVSLLTGNAPQVVQVVVSGLTAGQSVEVVAVNVVGGRESRVPGGVLTATGNQVVLADNWAPLNTPITYRVTIDGIPYVSDEVFVANPSGRYLLQSLDGSLVVDVAWVDNANPHTMDIRATVFSVPGRQLPPALSAPAGMGGGSHVFDTVGSDTNRMRDLLLAGRPVVLRTDGLIPDMDPTSVILPLSVSDELHGAKAEFADKRRWTIGYVFVDDPEPGAVRAGSTWLDFDAAMATRTGDDFDALFAFSTGDDLDAYDWRQLL